MLTTVCYIYHELFLAQILPGGYLKVAKNIDTFGILCLSNF